MNVLKELSTLSEKDLQEVKNRTDFLLSNKFSSSVSSQSTLLFYDIIAKQLLDLSGVTSPPFYIFQKNKAFKKLKEAHKFVDEYLLTILTNPLKQEKVHFYMLFTKIMLNYLEQYNLPKEISVIVNTHQKFPAQLNLAFPSYGASGLFSLLFKRPNFNAEK